MIDFATSPFLSLFLCLRLSSSLFIFFHLSRYLSLNQDARRPRRFPVSLVAPERRRSLQCFALTKWLIFKRCYEGYKQRVHSSTDNLCAWNLRFGEVPDHSRVFRQAFLKIDTNVFLRDRRWRDADDKRSEWLMSCSLYRWSCLPSSMSTTCWTLA